MDLDKLEKRIRVAETNLAIHRRDRGRIIKKLKKKYGVDEDDIEARLEEISEEIDGLEKKEKKLKNKLRKKIEAIEDER